MSSNYLDWNNRLAQYYFNEEMAGREVLLYANRKIINSIGEGLGDVADFISSVQVGPTWTTRAGLCQKALQAYEDWRHRALDYPPYIAFLVLFVLAEDVEGDFAPHAYYPRLNQLLGISAEQGRPASFDRMWELWADLEKWSKEDRNEELGRFAFRIRGEWRHVGLPLSQTLLSHDERSNLKVIFDKADIDPTDPPAIDILTRMLVYYGSRDHLLQKRTLTVLQLTAGQSIGLKNALIEFVLEELAEWDGTCSEVSQPDKGIIGEAKTGLRVCLNEDSLSRKVNTYLRLKTNRAIPDAGLEFTCSQLNKVLTCFETSANWSTPLRDQASAKYFDASSVNWNDGLQMKDIENGWRAKLKGASVRLFLPGKREGMPDWIESHHLERQIEFLVAVNSGMTDKIKNWGSQSCESFVAKDDLGLPSGWSLFYGKNATNSCDGVDVLTLSNLLQLRLVRGIKTGRGNTYLKFGLPSVMLENMSGLESIKINGSKIIQADQSIPIWELPQGLPLYQALRIEVYGDSSDPLQTRIIKIEDPHIQVALDEMPQRAPDGDILSYGSSDNFATGPIVNVADNKECSQFPDALPTHFSSIIVFLGSRPGEIRDWPDEELPEDWHPVWAVAKKGRKEWVVHFCGNTEHLKLEQSVGKPTSDPRAVKRWKEAIWINRKRCQPPALPILLKLWRKYLEAAKNA